LPISWRLGYPQYADVEAKLEALPVITVPTVTLDGEANGIIPAAMAGLPRPSSPADESTIGCRMRATRFRSKRRRSSPTQSWK
jgi:hypothetical protein